MLLTWASGTGKKKTCISRILLKEGNGKIIINKLKASCYFKRKNLINFILRPLFLISNNKFDIFINTKGGGEVSKAISIMYGLSKALVDYDIKYKKILKKNKMLTSDKRIVERKKVGHVKSRKRKQYTKR
ncbi:30S ribosomal protein S9 [Candidatus Vidania fulgoroideorum]